MRYLFLILLLVGCSKSDSSQSGALELHYVDQETDAPCKSIYSRWESTTDSEVHDFTNLGCYKDPWPQYTYTNQDGVQCGNGKLTARICKLGANRSLQLWWSEAAACREMVAPDFPTFGFNTIKKNCNTISICRNQNESDCKTFQ